MYLVAFTITYLLLRHQLRGEGLQVKNDVVLDLFFWAVLGLLVGARAFAVTIYDASGFYLRHPLQIILPFSLEGGRLRFTGIAGMSYHGGLVGAATAIIIFLKVKKLDVLEWGDMLTAAIPLGYTFGRLGNFINGELYGRITRAPWGVLFPHAEGFTAKDQWVKDFAAVVGVPVPGSGLVNLPRHPSQLYEALFEGLILWLVLWFIARKRKPYKGFVIACYVLGYGIVRFFIEYVRQPDQQIGFPITLVPLDNPSQFSFFNFSTGQILNLLMILGAIIFMSILRSKSRKPVPQLDVGSPSPRKLRKMAK
jgi:phosphatidylglycerol:prolipoprotein diacylglycerol transferase